MTKKRKFIRVGKIIIGLSFIFAVVETWYFGWNFIPINVAEQICDLIAQSMFIFGVMIYLAPLLKEYEEED